MVSEMRSSVLIISAFSFRCAASSGRCASGTVSPLPTILPRANVVLELFVDIDGTLTQNVQNEFAEIFAKCPKMSGVQNPLSRIEGERLCPGGNNLWLVAAFATFPQPPVRPVYNELVSNCAPQTR